MKISKVLSLIPFLFLLCSCEILGWDSSGGNSGDDENFNGVISTTAVFFIEVPAAYPYSGSSSITSTIDGDTVEVNNTDITASSDLNSLSNEDALAVVKAACDQTATSINSISVTTDAIVSWTNEGANTAELSISNGQMGVANLRLIECLSL